MKAVILAGGEGKRLRPLTFALPKPLLPVGKKPIAHHLVEKLEKHGFKEIYLTTGYHSELVQAYFRDGRDFGVNIHYSIEKKPLGTAGPLKLIEKELDEPFLVMNGDLYTDVKFNQIMEFHREKDADMTVCGKIHDITIPFGVLSVNEKLEITGVEEKPTIRNKIGAGMYVINPQLLELIPAGKRFDMPELIEKARKNGKKVCYYEIKDFWLDVGKVEDYEKINQMLASTDLE